MQGIHGILSSCLKNNACIYIMGKKCNSVLSCSSGEQGVYIAVSILVWKQGVLVWAA